MDLSLPCARVTGTLFICPTPLGNLEDITLRVLRILKEVDLIAAENTLHTQKLLNHFGIAKPMVSYYDSGKSEAKEEKLIEKLKNGLSIALVSSAGTPLMSDPGYRLVRKCIDEGIRVTSLPGPSALVTAVAASGLPPYNFFFGGFLPSKSGGRTESLRALADFPCTLILYEAPHRIVESLSDSLRILGDRPAAILRELTKIHEEIIRGKLSELLRLAKEKQLKGEITLVIGGKREEKGIETEKIKEEIQILLKKGFSLSLASREVAKKYGLPKNKIYSLAHHLAVR